MMFGAGQFITNVMALNNNKPFVVSTPAQPSAANDHDGFSEVGIPITIDSTAVDYVSIGPTGS
jgi:hypothetical protein